MLKFRWGLGAIRNAIGYSGVLLTITVVGCLQDEQPTENPLPGESPPTVSLTLPGGTEVLDTTVVTVNASDDKGVVKVEIFIDNQIPSGGTLITAPYLYVWDASALADSSAHIIYAKAYDADDNVSSSPVATVFVYRFKPSELAGTVFADTNVALVWRDNSKRETGFEVEQSVDDGPFSVVQSLNANVTSTIVSFGSTTRITLSFRVRAVSDGTRSGFSNEVEVVLGALMQSAAFPDNAANLAPGGAPAVGTIIGGTRPYSINTAPDAAVATAVMSGANSDTLTITPVAVGTTSVIVEDSAPSNSDAPAGAMLTINITVTAGGGGTGIGGSGTFSVNSSIGNLSASGTYDGNATSGQGVGGVRSNVTSPTASDQFYAYGYVARSATDFDVAVALMSYANGTLMDGTYPFLGTGMFGSFAVAFGVNPDNIEANLYIAATGTGVNLTSITATNAAGNASGSGYNINNPTLTFTFEGATFNVNNYGTGAAPEEPIRKAIEKALKELRRQAAIDK